MKNNIKKLENDIKNLEKIFKEKLKELGTSEAAKILNEKGLSIVSQDTLIYLSKSMSILVKMVARLI